MKLQNFLDFFIRPSKPVGWDRVPRKLYSQPEPGQQIPQIGKNSEGQNR